MDILKTLVYEIVEEKGGISDADLLRELQKRGVDANGKLLNKTLLHLEIHGLVSVRWIGKDVKRIEIGSRTVRQPQTIW